MACTIMIMMVIMTGLMPNDHGGDYGHDHQAM